MMTIRNFLKSSSLKKAQDEIGTTINRFFCEAYRHSKTGPCIMQNLLVVETHNINWVAKITQLISNKVKKSGISLGKGPKGRKAT